MDLAKLKAAYLAYNEKMRVAGIPLASYSVPCCGAILESRAAPDGECWDTLSICPECGGMHMKITNGAMVDAFALEG